MCGTNSIRPVGEEDEERESWQTSFIRKSPLIHRIPWTPINVFFEFGNDRMPGRLAENKQKKLSFWKHSHALGQGGTPPAGTRGTRNPKSHTACVGDRVLCTKNPLSVRAFGRISDRRIQWEGGSRVTR